MLKWIFQIRLINSTQRELFSIDNGLVYVKDECVQPQISSLTLKTVFQLIHN